MIDTIKKKLGCWICSGGARKAPGFHRLHVAAAKPHDDLLKALTREGGTLRTGRTAKLVRESGSDYVHLLCRVVHRNVSTWQHVATLKRDCVIVHLDSAWQLSQGTRQRVASVLAHRGGGAALYNGRGSLLVHFVPNDIKVQRALVEDTEHKSSWGDWWYAARWAVVSQTLTFFTDRRDPVGIARWKKNARMPTVNAHEEQP